MIHMMPQKTDQFSRPHTALVHLCPQFLYPLDLEHPISIKTPSPNDNQSIKRQHNPRMTIICFQDISSGCFFLFSINSKLVWLSFDFFSFSWSLNLPPFLEIQDVPTFHSSLAETKVLNNSCNQFVYHFYSKCNLVLEECLQKLWNANLITLLNVFWSILWKETVI